MKLALNDPPQQQISIHRLDIIFDASKTTGKMFELQYVDISDKRWEIYELNMQLSLY
jgi:hypothetical protein